jgi:L-alanine-DL-glutamate epimerase-like enolase superfamily enzyme
MVAELTAFKITRFEFPRDRRIGDSQVTVPDVNWVGTLELFDAEGRSGLGFFADLFDPLPKVAFLEDYFARALWCGLQGQVPEGILNKVTRPRGGNIRPILFGLDEAVDVALWDLVGKHASMPLHKLLGGTRDRQAAYCSGLCFHLSDQEAYDFYTAARREGYCAYKIKVGHRDVDWDLRRLRLVAAAVGSDARLMVDANEAWSANEAARRLRSYADAEFDIYWVEDPVLRHDFVALRELRQRVGAVNVNAGEYLSPDERLISLLKPNPRGGPGPARGPRRRYSKFEWPAVGQSAHRASLRVARGAGIARKQHDECGCAPRRGAPGGGHGGGLPARLE